MNPGSLVPEFMLSIMVPFSFPTLRVLTACEVSNRIISILQRKKTQNMSVE